MHHSFHAVDGPGDTQPDSQIYRDWTSGVFPVPEVDAFARGPKSLFTEHEEDEDNEDEDDLLTDEEATGSSQPRNHTTITSPTVVDNEDRVHEEQDSLALTSPLKFETPALAGRKRNNSGQMLSSAMRTNTTPGTVASVSAFGAAFGNGPMLGGPLMSLTQAWHNTQAPTSPIVGGASEDAVFTRPSPNFTNLRQSSPIPAYSSPIKAVRSETPRSDPILRSSSEPRAEYVTLEQSQERRKLSSGEEQMVAMEQDSWEELSRQVKARKAREQFHRKAARSLSYVSAPGLASPQLKKNRKTRIRKSSPARSKSSLTRPATGLREEGDADEEDDEDHNAVDELSRSMLRKDHIVEDSCSESSPHILSTERAVVKCFRNENVQVPKTSSNPHRTPLGLTSHESSEPPSPSSQLQRESQLRVPRSQPRLRSAFEPQSSRDSVAVMDSQPDAIASFDSIPRPKSLRFPSSPSTNQYSINQTTIATRTGYTSQVVSSSMPPLPPKSSAEEASPEAEVAPAEEERVPSSPPLLDCDNDDNSVHENDLEYDEHTYDEYVEAEVAEVPDSPAANEDTIVHEDEELPVAKPGLREEDVDENDIATDEENDSDLIQPQKVDLGTDQEIPETLEQEHYDPNNRDYEEATVDDLHNNEEIDQVPRVLRQNTIPETDALDETQPSFFPESALHEAFNTGLNAPNQTNSTEAFQTAQEEVSVTQNNIIVPVSSKEDGSDIIQASDRIRSLSDVHNLPATQQSCVEEEIEMPRLSGLDEDEADTAMTDVLPKPPPAKRRKVTYTAKRKTFLNLAKSPTDSDSLSDPPPSPALEEARPVFETSMSNAPAKERDVSGAALAVVSGEDTNAPETKPATLKSLGSRRRSNPGAKKKGALKPVPRELLQSLSSPANSPSKSKGATEGGTSTLHTPTRRRVEAGSPSKNINMSDGEMDELAGTELQPLRTEGLGERPSTSRQTPTGDVLVPNRVFASWPGSHYYPATCIGRPTLLQLKIRYDDGNVTSLDAPHVRALDLKIGDHVKVDEAGMKKNTYVIVGFKDRIDDLEGEEFPTTDRYGFATIVLEEKRSDHLPQAKSFQPSEHISVPVASIYLTASLWARLRDRSFNFSPLDSPVKSASRTGIPVMEPLALGSFNRRGTAGPSLLKDISARAASVASTARSGSRTFSNMAFVLTSTVADVDKEGIARNIKINGGLVLEQGFHELFEFENTEPPSSQSRRRSISSIEDFNGPALKHAYKDLGFVALISDSHSRSTKYLQALALNVPCLHLRWIGDSLSASRALPFPRYLLPAGVSKFLDPNGVVRSRTMRCYDPAGDDVSFAQIIRDRDLLLQGQTVLLITGKSKKEMDRQQPFVFLTHALGSANVGRCADLAAAAKMLRDSQWDWVYVDNGERGVADAAADLFGTARPSHGIKSKKSKKRKRDESEEKEGLVARGVISGRAVRITCAEFVIQSLILGALIEE